MSIDLKVESLKEVQQELVTKLKWVIDEETRKPEDADEIEIIDIWQNLPVKDEVSLQELEIKLKENDKYRKKMVERKYTSFTKCAITTFEKIEVKYSYQ